MKIKKKLKNITIEEYKKWEKIKDYNASKCCGCPFQRVTCDSHDRDCWVYNKNLYSEKFLNQEIEVEVPDILDEVEKEYLSSVIRPFRKRVDSIMKSSNSCCDKEYIFINLDDDWLSLPYFKTGIMYQGMELEKAYTLEELGL